jgi:hypothetical protein
MLRGRWLEKETAQRRPRGFSRHWSEISSHRRYLSVLLLRRLGMNCSQPLPCGYTQRSGQERCWISTRAVLGAGLQLHLCKGFIEVVRGSMQRRTHCGPQKRSADGAVRPWCRSVGEAASLHLETLLRLERKHGRLEQVD